MHGRCGNGAALAEDLAAAAAEPWWPLAFLPSTLVDEEDRRLWIEEMDFDVRPILERVRVPTLLFYGADDAWTPVAASINAWREARSDIEVVVIPKAGHELTTPDGTLAADYEKTLVDWLLNLGSRRQDASVSTLPW